MAIISSFSLIKGLSIFHITIAYFLLTSPQTLSEQNIVFLLGEAMHLPQVSSFDAPTPATAFVAILFLILALSDFTAVSMAEPVAMQYWGTQAPIRLVVLFALTAYTYFGRSPVPQSSPFGNSKYHHMGPGDSLKNGLLFTWAFLEMGVWFLVFLSLREERRQTPVRMEWRREVD